MNAKQQKLWLAVVDAATKIGAAHCRLSAAKKAAATVFRLQTEYDEASAQYDAAHARWEATQ